MPPEQRTPDRYLCPVCGARWDAKELKDGKIPKHAHKDSYAAVVLGMSCLGSGREPVPCLEGRAQGGGE